MAKVLSPEELLQIAIAHERRLTTKERRCALTYITDHRLDTACKTYRSNYQIAALFNVSEGQIRSDRKRMLREHSAQITPEQAMAFVSDALRSQERLIRRAEDGLSVSVEGSLAERDYIELIDKLEARRLKIAQDIGIVAKELGRLQVSEEVWEATVLDDVPVLTNVTGNV